jgi:hypothetical protein
MRSMNDFDYFEKVEEQPIVKELKEIKSEIKDIEDVCYIEGCKYVREQDVLLTINRHIKE